jgi:SPP1 family predicted phage head-tail adaptor
MPLQSGQLRHRVSIEVNTPTRSATGAEVPGWTLLADRWAAVLPQAGREFYAAKQLHAEVTHLITIRGPLAVQPEMRIRMGGRLFDILSVIDVEERHQELRLLCREGAGKGV